MSASAYATFDPPAPHVGVRRPAEVTDRLAAVRAGNRADAMPRLWLTLDLSVRLVLVMLACGQTGRPEMIARQAWGSFSEADQLAMASAARLIRSSLSDFAAVA